MSMRQGVYSVSRRKIVTVGGSTLVGTALLGPISGLLGQEKTRTRVGTSTPGVTTKNGGSKPVYVPEEGSKDPIAHSIAENLFWTDILMEHAKFFAMLMPGPDL